VFPNVRELGKEQSAVGDPQSGILSSGAACRMQIRQGTGVDAMHPIMLIAEFIKGSSKPKNT
jgi:Fe-S oxidoreductase